MFEVISTLLTSGVAWITAISGNNHFLTATIVAGLAIIGRGLPSALWTLIKNRLTVELTIKDPSIHDREELIDSIVNSSKATNGLFTRRYIASYNNSRGVLEVQTGLGWHIVRVKQGWILIILRHQEVESGYLRILDIVTFRWWAKNLHGLASSVGGIDSDTIPLFAVSETRWSSRNGNFQNTGTIKRSRYANQKQLINPEQYDVLYSHVKRFMEDPNYYEELNIAHKECFLLYGPPGTGKSSLARHFSCLVGLPVIKVNPLNISKVREGMKFAGITRAMLLLDDIDEYLNQEDCGATGFRGKPKVDIGDLINELDGVAPMDGCLIFINTNSVELLKSKLYRPGRVDLRMELTYPRPEVILDNVGYPQGDLREVKLLQSGILANLPLHYVGRLRRAKDVNAVEGIVDDCNRYFKLVEESQV